MVHAQKPDLASGRKGRVHLNRRGGQVSRLLELYALPCRVCTARASLFCSHVTLTRYPFHSLVSPSLLHRVSPCAITFQTQSTTDRHLVSLPSTACTSTRTRPLSVSSSSDWLRLFLGQTFSRINTPKISSQLFFLLTPLMKMEQSVPKRRHIKFRRQGITQKKAYKI